MGDQEDPIAYFLLAICAGIYWFFKGFGLYRKYRLLADTAVTAVRSAAMGLIEVHGTVCDGATMQSPVCDLRCFYSEVKIDAWIMDTDGGGTWQNVTTRTKGSNFYLQDDTGRILVDPAGAEMDLPESGERVAGQVISRGSHHASSPSDEQHFQTLSLATPAPASPTADPSPSEAELLEYVKESVPGAAAHKKFRGMYRLTEYSIVPGQALSITGTCCENPSPQDPEDHNLLKKGEKQSTFLISMRSEKDLMMNLRKRAKWHILGGSLLSVVSLATLLVWLGWFRR